MTARPYQANKKVWFVTSNTVIHGFTGSGYSETSDIVNYLSLFISMLRIL